MDRNKKGFTRNTTRLYEEVTAKKKEYFIAGAKLQKITYRAPYQN